MVYIQGMMHKKIHLGLALLILLIVAISAAFALTARAVAPWYFGGRITVVVPESVCSDPDTCSACKNCGCGAWSDVTIQPYRGGQSYVCVPAGFSVQGKGLTPGLQTLGHGSSPYTPIRIWTVP